MSENSWVIGDKELENLFEEGKDQLGTKKYVDQLFNIIINLSDKELEKGFNIGLYGGWGSGKSSIVKTLEDKIEKECNNEFVIIDFDCRKYSNDDLRRSILLEIASKYDSKVLGEVKNLIYHDRQEIIKKAGPDFSVIKAFFKWLKTNRNRLSFIIVFLVISLLVVLLLWVYQKSHTLFEIIISGGLIASLSAIVQFIGKIYDYLREFIPKIEITHNIMEGKVFSGEQFEELFNILIQKNKGDNTTQELVKLVNKNQKICFKDKKIIFVFDNIDRCESSIVKEILMTIKTFLNQNNCVFLLPIDYENVCKSYESYDQGDEYLRKIFNLGINIKPPHYSKLSDLVMNLMETNLRKDEKGLNITDDEASTIAYILASAFADNPRKIKQFLNQLGAEYMLYNKEKPLLSILKELIIKVEMPKLYNHLIDEQNIVFANENLNDYIAKRKKLKNKDGKDEDFSEREQILLNKIGKIKERLELLDDENIKIEKVYHSPMDFITLIKNDGIKKEARDFLCCDIEPARGGGIFSQIDLVENTLYYIAEYGFDQILFDNIFEEGSEFAEKDVMNCISTIDLNMLYKFIKKIGEKYVKVLPKNFKNILTDRLITNFEKEIDVFKKLDKNLQNLLVDRNIILKYHNEEVENENFKESNYFKFLQNFPEYITENFVKTIFKDIDYNSFDFSQIKSNNLIHILSIMKKYSDTLLENINTICKKFIEQDQHFIRNYEGINKKEVDLFLECAKIIIINGDNENLHDKLVSKLVDLYNGYPNSSFSEKLYNIFLEEFSLREPYKRPYADIIIDKNNINYINKMIDGTSNEGEDRLGLENQHIEKIINKISREDDNWNNIIQSIRKNKSIKNILFNRINGINNDDEIISKIKKLDNLHVLSEDEKKLFGSKFTENLENRLTAGTLEKMGEAVDFIQKYKDTDIIKHIDYNTILNLLNSFDMSIFGNKSFDEVVSYNEKLEDAKEYLLKLKKKK